MDIHVESGDPLESKGEAEAVTLGEIKGMLTGVMADVKTQGTRLEEVWNRQNQATETLEEVQETLEETQETTEIAAAAATLTATEPLDSESEASSEAPATLIIEGESDSDENPENSQEHQDVAPKRSLAQELWHHL